MATKRSSAKKKRASQKPAPSTVLTVPEAPWTMKACIAALGIKGKAVWNVVASLGPRALALWPAASRNLLSHQMGKDAIAGWRNALDRENTDFAEIEKALVAKIPKAKPEDIVEIQQKIEFLRGLRCQGNVVGKALAHLATKPDSMPALAASKTNSPSPEEQAAVISEHWTDHFNRFARQRNEPWREQLLARALAAESERPGSISPRLLWLIGTLEATKFERLAALLDLAATIKNSPVIPGANVWYDTRPIPNFTVGAAGVANLAASLSDTALLHSHDVSSPMRKDVVISASYDGETYRITCNDLNGRIEGIHFTSLGEAIAELYERSPNDYGRMLFKRWIEDLIPSRFTVTKVGIDVA